MKAFFKGDIKQVYVEDIKFKKETSYIKGLELTSTKIEVLTNTKLVHPSAYFYENLFGKINSIDYGCPLPTLEEATTYVENAAKNQPANKSLLHCIYIDEESLKPINLTAEEAHQLRKRK